MDLKKTYGISRQTGPEPVRPLHSSVHTSTSLNTRAVGEQFLTVITTRLVILADGTAKFERSGVTTAVHLRNRK